MTESRHKDRSTPGWLMTPWAISAGVHILIAGLLAWSLTGPPMKPRLHARPGEAGEVVATVRFLTAEQASAMQAGRTVQPPTSPISPDAPPPTSQPLASRQERQTVEPLTAESATAAERSPGEALSSVAAPPPLAPAAPAVPDSPAPPRPIEPTPAAAVKRGVRTDHDAQLIDLPTPQYPPLSKRNGEQGVVIVEVVVNPDGSVDSARVIQSPGHARLESAALAAAKAARFTPARRNGQPVHASVRIPYRFVIEP